MFQSKQQQRRQLFNANICVQIISIPNTWADEDEQEREIERERERERERKYDDLQMPDHSRKDEAFLLQISFD